MNLSRAMTFPVTSRSIGLLVSGFAVCLAVGCRGEEEARRTPVDMDTGSVVADVPIDVAPVAERVATGMTDGDSHVIFGCLEGDSAVYGGPSPDPVADAAPSVRIDLWQAGDGIDGSTVTMAGESVPLAGVRLVGRDSISLAISPDAAAADTTVFVGRVACDSLWGGQRSHRQAPPRHVTYLRLR